MAPGQCAALSQKLSNFCLGRMGDQNLLSRATPCLGRHIKFLVPAAFAFVSTHSRRVEVRQAADRKKYMPDHYHNI
jgi:hypothetical protein